MLRGRRACGLLSAENAGGGLVRSLSFLSSRSLEAFRGLWFMVCRPGAISLFRPRACGLLTAENAGGGLGRSLSFLSSRSLEAPGPVVYSPPKMPEGAL